MAPKPAVRLRQSIVVTPPGTIAAAVEEQGAATQEIARNVGEAAKGTTQVANNITDPKKIQPGQELIIPAKSSLAAKGSKPKAGAAAAEEVKPAPAGDQDLDSGLKPGNPADVPVVKIEDNPPAQQPKNP